MSRDWRRRWIPCNICQDSEARRLYEFFEKVKNLGASYGRVPQNKELSQAAIAWPLGQPLFMQRFNINHSKLQSSALSSPAAPQLNHAGQKHIR